MTNLRFLRRFRRNDRGGAAVEMSLVCLFLALGIMNVTELARYSYARMQMSAASQAAVSAAFAACDTAHVPATTRCSGLNTAVSNAVHSSALAGNIEVQGNITEGWYCLNLSHQLEYVGSAGGIPPTDCTAVNNVSGQARPLPRHHRCELLQRHVPGRDGGLGPADHHDQGGLDADAVMMRLLTRFRSDRTGTSAIEFALVLPAFVLLTVGSLAVCALLYATVNLQFAVEDAARCAAVKTTVCTDATATAAYAQARYVGPPIAPVFTYTTSPCAHTLQANATLSLNFIPALTNVPIRAVSCYP